MWWGHSPALDIQAELQAAHASLADLHAINILVVGSGDARHVIRTLANSYRHPTRQLHFFVLEPSIEVLARELFLLTLACEPPDVLGVTHKARMFLEVYGNTLVRPQTLHYIRQKASQLIYMVTDMDYLKKRFPLISLEYLRYKERDFLESVFKFWRNASSHDFDIEKLWDDRLRTSLGTRYDSRDGLFDWDYHMKLNSSVEGGLPISTKEYTLWREKGLAFHWPETECSEPNVTLASGLAHYLGDQNTGPFLGFGIQCEDADMMRKVNNRFVKRTSDIAERNLTRLMYELVHKQPYVVEPEEGGAMLILEEPRPRLGDSDVTIPLANCPREEYTALSTGGASVTFLSPTTLDEERLKTRYRGSFHVICLSQAVLPQLLSPDLLTMAADKALLLLEGRRFVVGPRRRELQEFNEQLLEAALEAGCEPLQCISEPAKLELIKYTFERP